MRFETESYFFRAVDAHGIDASRLEAYAEPVDGPTNFTFAIPREHSRILFLARQLLAASAQKSDCLLMPTLWNVWPSAENWHLYGVMRATYGGANTTLKERPCHCLSAGEPDVTLDFLYLFLLFSWDFYVFSYHKEDILFVSHDGFGTYFSPHRMDHVRSKLEYLTDLQDDELELK